ncbi:MAG: hypothetical protein ACM3MF_07060, partial [Anaerolineae bacterium]
TKMRERGVRKRFMVNGEWFVGRGIGNGEWRMVHREEGKAQWTGEAPLGSGRWKAERDFVCSGQYSVFSIRS